VETYDHTLLGERVRRARMRLGWNQKRLAEATGIPQGNISRIERGRNTEYSGAAGWTSSQLLKIGYTLSVKTGMVEEVHGNQR